MPSPTARHSSRVPLSSDKELFRSGTAPNTRHYLFEELCGGFGQRTRRSSPRETHNLPLAPNLVLSSGKEPNWPGTAPNGRFHRFQELCGQVGHSLQKTLNLVEIYRLLTLSLLYISSTFSHLVKLILNINLIYP